MERLGAGYIGWLDSLSDPPREKSSRVGVDDTAVKINDEWFFIVRHNTDSKRTVFESHGTDQAAAFLHGYREKHDISEAEFTVN